MTNKARTGTGKEEGRNTEKDAKGQEEEEPPSGKEGGLNQGNAESNRHKAAEGCPNIDAQLLFTCFWRAGNKAKHECASIHPKDLTNKSALFLEDFFEERNLEFV